MINQFTEQSIHRIADVVRTVESEVRTLTPDYYPEAGSDVMLIPVRVKDGTDGTYSGVEQTWDTTLGNWVDTESGLEWEPDGSVGPLIEMNQREGLDDSVFYASYFGDTDEDILWAFFAGFGGGADETIALGSYVDSSGNLRFWDGDVNFGETILQVSEASGGYDFTTGYFYVEMDATFGIDGADYTINTEIQNDSTQPLFYELDDTVHKVRWPLVEINADDELKVLWHGDILDFGLGESDATEFIYLNEIQVDETFGMKMIFDKKTDLFTIGRKTASQIDETVSEFTLDGAEWTALDAQTSGALLVHKQSPVEDTGDDRHWFKSKHEGGVSIDGVDASSITYYWDTRQHMWGYEVDGDGTIIGPPPSGDETSGQNARYTNCDGVGSVIIDTSIGSVIKANGQCWEFDSITTQKTNATADSTYIDCTSCEQNLNNELWFDCDTSAIGINLSGGHITDDFAWICYSGVWEKFYDSGLDSTDTPTDPSALLQCGVTPTDCSDLVGWPCSDDWGGQGCNSGAVGDTNWDVRWTSTVLYGNSLTLSLGGQFDLLGSGINQTEGNEFPLNLKASEFDQDWTIEFEISANMTQPDGGYGGPDCLLFLSTGDRIGHIAWEDSEQSGAGWYTNIGGSLAQHYTGFGTRTIKVVFTELTNTAQFYIDGGLVGTRSGVSVSSCKLYIANEAAHTTRLTLNYTIGDFIMKNGANEILIDPTGVACT